MFVSSRLFRSVTHQRSVRDVSCTGASTQRRRLCAPSSHSFGSTHWASGLCRYAAIRPQSLGRRPVYRHASSPDRGSVDDEMDVLMSLWESIGEDEEQVKAALTEHGLESTGDMEEDLMALVPFEKAKRDGQQAAEQPVVGLTKDITEGIEASSERAARQEASGGVEAEGPAGGDDGDNSNEAQIRAALGELTKPDIQDRLRRLQMKVTGSKGDLLDTLAEVYVAANKQGMSPENYRARQLRDEKDEARKPPTSEPASDDEPNDSWSLIQLRNALRERGQIPRGNKADLIDTLLRTRDNFNKGDDNEPATTSDAQAPWEEEAKPLSAEAKAQKKREEERDRQRRELNRLTVTEILNLLKSRRVPIGAKKKKEELVERLLDSIYPLNPSPAAQTPGLAGLEGQQAIDRADLLRLMKDLIPKWNPSQLTEDIELMPILQIQQELTENGLSADGGRKELVDRLQRNRPDLWESLEDLSLDSARELMQRLGIFDGEPGEESFTARMYERLITYPWSPPEASAYKDAQLLSLKEMIPPSDPGDPIRVAMLVVLGPGFQGEALLRSAQTAFQQLQTTIGQGFVGRGIDAVSYFAFEGQWWKCPVSSIYTPSCASLLAALKETGSRFDDKQALLKDLQSSADAILPILCDEDRSILEDLESLGVDYIGSSAFAGSQAANKHKCRQRLSELGYPTIPQLSIDVERFSNLPGEEHGPALQQWVQEWLEENDVDAETTATVVKPAVASSAAGLLLANGVNNLLDSIASLIDQGAQEVIVEPLLRDAVEFSCLVLGTEEGPVAGMPLEVSIQNPDEVLVDAQLEMTRFFSTTKGFTNEDELYKELWHERERYMTSTPSMVLFDSAAKLQPSNRVSIRSPPHLPAKVTLAIREAACKAFKDLQLKDYALIEGFVQLPQKDPPPREVPEELERYEPPDVHALKHRLRKNDNSDLIPPWDPPDQEDEQIADLNAYSEFLSDPDFKDMGPYTDPGVADEYHSNDVQLRETHSEGEEPAAEVVEAVAEMTEEEEEAFLNEGDYWHPDYYTPDSEMLLDLDDGEQAAEEEFAEAMARLRAEQEEAEGAGASQSGEALGEDSQKLGSGSSRSAVAQRLLIRDDDDGLREPLEIDVPDHGVDSAAQLCLQEGATILITDVNVSPRLEASSPVFLAAANSGLTPSMLLRHLVAQSCARRGRDIPPILPVDTVDSTIFAPPILAEPELTWDMFPPVTEREMALPWYHERFRLVDDPVTSEDGGPRSEGDRSPGSGQVSRVVGGQITGRQGTTMGAQTAEGDGYPGREGNDSDPVELEGPLARALAEEAETDALRSNGNGAMADRGEDNEGVGDAAGPEPHRVWVLCGGTGSGADASLASGIHVYHELLKHPDIVAEIFVMAPMGSTVRELNRRKDLIRRHVQRVKLTSDPETSQPEELKLHHIRNPSPPNVNITERHVWGVPPHLLLHKTVSQVHEACEMAVLGKNVVTRHQEEWQEGEGAMQDLVLAQLRVAGVDEAGFAWGAECEATRPQCLDMYEWSVRARVCKATIFSTLQSGTSETGQALALLDNMVTVYTGSGTLAATRCSDKGRLAEALANLDMQVIETPPKFRIELAQLFRCVEVGEEDVDNEEAELEARVKALERGEDLMQEARQHLGLPADDPVCIRPGVGISTAGVCRLDNVLDLTAYGLALKLRQHSIPELSLSWGNPRIALSPHSANYFYLEPYIAADSLVMLESEDEGQSGNVTWSDSNHWAAAIIGLFGAQGKMMAMTPSLIAHTPTYKAERLVPNYEANDAEEEYLDDPEEKEPIVEEVAVQGQPVHLCPPPKDIVPPELVTKVQERAERVAAQLGLSGLACLHGFVNADTGELKVVDVDTSPPLHPGSAIYAQTMDTTPLLTPSGLFRRIVRLAETKEPDPEMTRALEADVTPPDYDMEGGLCTYPGQEDEPAIELIEPVESMLRALHNQSEDIFNYGYSVAGDYTE